MWSCQNDKEPAGTHNKWQKNGNIHKKEFRILAESCGDSIKFCGTYDEKSMLIKGKTFTQIEESCLSAEQKEQMEETYFKKDWSFELDKRHLDATYSRHLNLTDCEGKRIGACPDKVYFLMVSIKNIWYNKDMW